MEKMCNNQIKIMNYLINKVKNGEKLPCLDDMSKDLEIKYCTLSDNLIKLRKMGKIDYKCGRVLRVIMEDFKGVVSPKVVEQHKNKYTIGEFEDKYNQAVKDLVCDYVKSIDANAFGDLNNINKIMGNITFITNKLKEKLFN